MFRHVGKLLVQVVLVLAGVAVGYMMFSGTKWREYEHNALELAREGHHEEAVAEWLKAKSEADKDPSPDGVQACIRAQKQLAVLYDLHLRDYAQAIKEYKALVEHFPETAEARWAAERLARIAADKRPDVLEAETWYRWLIDHTPAKADQNRFRNLLARQLVEIGDFARAREVLTELLETQPEDIRGAKALFLFGESYFLEKKYEQALERFRLLRERYPSTRQAQLAGLEVGTCLYELERYPEAAAVLKQTLSVYPNPAVVKTKLDKVTSKLKLLKYDEPIKENEFWLSTQRRRQGAPPASSSQTDIPPSKK